MTAIYNEIEPFAAQWMRELIAQGHIAPGVVDERSIADLTASDIAGPVQRHFFAGVGVWSYALRLAGVTDTSSIWTGSCPCQPFSSAGRRRGTADERHLWPVWFRLIADCKPAIVFGEQVASKDGWDWLRTVRADLEGAGYRVGAAGLPACGVGAPHKRERIYFVADMHDGGLGTNKRNLWSRKPDDGRGGAISDLGNSERERSGSRGIDESHRRPPIEPDRSGAASNVGHTSSPRGGRDAGAVPRAETASPSEWGVARRVVDVPVAASPTRGFWRDADWLLCRDGKARPVEPGTFPLAHGAAARMGRVRGYGNAINVEQAATFIRAAFEAMTEAP